ncbi:GDSL-type esterase/lipase family protein [Dyadobacter jejuensis]|nr:GDSL-type esterase/lipase family protein [Dyadobacter jejuensis]
MAIVFIGNSITQGKGGPNGAPPPSHTVDYLLKKRTIKELPYINVGRSGSTTVDWLPTTGRYYALAIKAADSLWSLQGGGNSLLFSIKLGTNDSAIKGPNGAPVEVESYKANLKQIIDALLAAYPGSRVMVHHPIWYSPNTYNSAQYLAEGLARLNRYILQIDALVADYSRSSPGKVFLGDTKAYLYFKKHPQYYKPELGQQGTFYLHPNEQGVKILGKYWAKAIAKAFL